MAKVFKGGRNNDRINGTAGRDVIVGNQGNDHLNGRGGHDVLKGGPGNDTLIGGKGHDSLFGGEGHDVFKFSVGDGGVNPTTGWDDFIYDFKDGVDKIDVPIPQPGFVTVTDFVSIHGAGAEVAYSNGIVTSSVFVIGFSSLLASADDFI